MSISALPGSVPGLIFVGKIQTGGSPGTLTGDGLLCTNGAGFGSLQAPSD